MPELQPLKSTAHHHTMVTLELEITVRNLALQVVQQQAHQKSL